MFALGGAGGNDGPGGVALLDHDTFQVIGAWERDRGEQWFGYDGWWHLSGSIWAWHRDGDGWAVEKVLTIPAEPADPDLLPPALKPFGAVPPRETGSVRLGGIVGRQPHPAAPDQPLGGGPQMVELSRDGRRVYITNSLYGVWMTSSIPTGWAPGPPNWTRTPTPAG